MQLPYRFGRYVLTEKIAQGGMAEIFKAKYLGEGGFSKDVVIKRLLPNWSDNPDFIKMLIDEARALVYLAHPNIVPVFELGRDGKIFYISMEWVDGFDLRRFFLKAAEDHKPIPLKFILYIVSEVLKALQFAHRQKDEKGEALHLVHRDISPQNILLSLKGEVKLTDFGIAKGSHRTLETTQSQIKGKYAYMSPEQAAGEAVGAEADLYALGIIFYELLEGVRLFDGINDLATLDMARASRLPNNALERWPPFLQVIVFKALNKDPRYRFASAKEFLSDVNRFAAAQHLRTDELEFANYLEALFPKTVAVNQSAVENAKPPPHEKKRLPLYARAASILFMMGASLPRAIPPASPASLSFFLKAEPAPKIVLTPQIEPATLRVSAKPWGFVTIPDVVSKRETPINHLELAPGRYQLQIHFPPTDQRLEKRIELAGGGVIRCYADFEGAPHLRCR